MAKVCVIGLDGATFAVIDYLTSQGRMPNFSRLRSEGSEATLLSTIPPLTPAAWSSFFTGTNPGKTGAVGFFRFRPGTYQMEPMNARNLQGEPLWQMASRHGKRVCVYNVPVTYPAAPVNGILISGMDAPRFDEQAIWPRGYRESFLKAIPDFKVSCELDADYLLAHSDHPVAEGIRQLKEHLSMEIRVVNHLMGLEDWDLLVAVLRSPDSIQHIFWADAEKVMAGEQASEDEAARAEAVFSCYDEIDRELGERWLGWCEGRDLIFISDHGFGRLKADVCLNRVLAGAGLVTFRARSGRRGLRDRIAGKAKAHLPAQTRQKIKKLMGKGEGDRWHSFVDSLVADIDWEKTRLFSVAQHGCLYVNLKGREPLGTVEGEQERQAVLAEAEAALSRLTDPSDGQPVVTGFFRKEDIYRGPLMDSMPDLVISMRDWSYRGIYSTAVELSQEPLFRTSDNWGVFGHTGNHRRDGILVMHGPDIARARLDTAEMVDVMPTILHLMGLPVPEDADGRVLEEALGSAAVKAAAVDAGKMETAAAASEAASAAAADKAPACQQKDVTDVYSQEDEEEIRKRLEKLGYL